MSSESTLIRVVASFPGCFLSFHTAWERGYDRRVPPLNTPTQVRYAGVPTSDHASSNPCVVRASLKLLFLILELLVYLWTLMGIL